MTHFQISFPFHSQHSGGEGNFPNSQTQHILSSAVLYSFSPSSQLLHISSLFSVRFILFLRRRARVRCLPFFSPPSSSLSSPKASTHSSAQHQSEGMEKKKRRKKLFAKVSLSQWIAVELYGSVFEEQKARQLHTARVYLAGEEQKEKSSVADNRPIKWTCIR